MSYNCTKAYKNNRDTMKEGYKNYTEPLDNVRNPNEDLLASL
jgi:hypothetical protein